MRIRPRHDCRQHVAPSDVRLPTCLGDDRDLGMRRDLRQPTDRGRRALPTALTVNAALLWLAILVQAAFAGSFLSGASDALAWHEANAAVIGFAALGQLMLATFAALAGRARWPVIASGVIFFAIGNQISLGYDRDLAVHVPLGVAVFGAQTATVLSLVFGRRSRPRSAARARPLRWRRRHAGSPSRRDQLGAPSGSVR